MQKHLIRVFATAMATTLFAVGVACSSFAQGGPPIITNQPHSQVVSVGDSSTFAVGVKSATKVLYQWRLNGVNIRYATNGFYTVTNTQPSRAGNYSCAVTNTGGFAISSNALLTVVGVLGWGNNAYGQATNGPPGSSNVVKIASGTYHCLALQSDGRVEAWGFNTNGECNVPPGLSNVVAIAAGLDHSMALISDGTVVAWGLNTSGQTNVPPGLSSVVGIAAGANHSLAVRADGTVVAWGLNNHLQTSVPTELTDPATAKAVAVSAGQSHSLALKSDGTVVAWGFSNWGQGFVPDTISNVVAIAAGDSHNVVLERDGTVQAWGQNVNGQAMVPGGLSDVVAIAAGELHSLALKSSGVIVGWGDNTSGQLTVPTGFTNVVALEAGGESSLGLKRDGSVFVTLQPPSQSAHLGTPLSLTVMAAGKGPLAYQWYLDGAIILGETRNTLTRGAVQTGDAGTYSVLVTNSLGEILSSNAVVGLAGIAPSITQQPQSQTVNQGSPVQFSVGATGSSPLQYQWFHEGTNLAGASLATYTIPAATPQHAGIYSVLVSNAAGSVPSSNALLSVNVPLVLLTSPAWSLAGFQFRLTGPVGNYVIEASTNLSLWDAISTNSTTGTGVLDFTDPAALGKPLRFYRALAK